VLAIDDPDVLGSFLSGAGPSVALLARRNVTRVERLLTSMYERAGVAVTVRTLAAHEQSSGGRAMGRTVSGAPGALHSELVAEAVASARRGAQ
jgi:homoserine kinase